MDRLNTTQGPMDQSGSPDYWRHTYTGLVLGTIQRWEVDLWIANLPDPMRFCSATPCNPAGFQGFAGVAVRCGPMDAARNPRHEFFGGRSSFSTRHHAARKERLRGDIRRKGSPGQGIGSGL